MVGDDELAGDRQAEPAPAGVGGAGEAIEDPVGIAGDAGTGVGHGDDGGAALLGDVDVDPAARRRVADGVRHHVRDHLGDAERVGVDDHRRRRRDRDLDPASTGQRGQRSHGVAHHGAELDRLRVQDELAGVAGGQRAEVLDEAVERAGLVKQQVEALVVARVDAVELQLYLPLQHGERRAQLVGDIGQEALTGALGCVEPGGHVVEGVAERAHRPRSVRVDAGWRTRPPRCARRPRASCSPAGPAGGRRTRSPRRRRPRRRRARPADRPDPAPAGSGWRRRRSRARSR